jgi:hypothetical protein
MKDGVGFSASGTFIWSSPDCKKMVKKRWSPWREALQKASRSSAASYWHQYFTRSYDANCVSVRVWTILSGQS